jgi:hypothetical protein
MVAAQGRPRHGDHGEDGMIGQWHFMVSMVITMRYMFSARGALRCTAWLVVLRVSAGLCYSQRSVLRAHPMDKPHRVLQHGRPIVLR